MSVSRIKTVVIAALVLINIFFLTVIVIDTVADARSERQAIENVCAVLRTGGIIISPSDARADSSLRTMRTTRGDEAEAVIVDAVLGPTDTTIQGARHSYDNAESGTAVFSSGGDFEILVNNGVITKRNGAVRTVQRLLRKMRLEASELRLTGEQGRESVTATSSYKGASIINCVIEFVFSDENLVAVRGKYVSGIELADDGTGMANVSTALLGFLAAVRNDEREDVACTRIFNVETGYLHHTVGPFGEGEITPVWLITTDMGRYIIDDASGEIQLLAQ